MNDGDKMGYLWKEGFFQGVDPNSLPRAGNRPSRSCA